MVLCITQFAAYHETIMPRVHIIIAFRLGQQNITKPYIPSGKTNPYITCSFKRQPPKNKPAKLIQKAKKTPTKMLFETYPALFSPLSLKKTVKQISCYVRIPVDKKKSGSTGFSAFQRLPRFHMATTNDHQGFCRKSLRQGPLTP